MATQTWQSSLMADRGRRRQVEPIDDLNAELAAAGFVGKEGRERFAALLGIEPRTFDGYFSKGIPPGRLPTIRMHLERAKARPPLESFDDWEIMADLARRLGLRRQESQPDDPDPPLVPGTFTGQRPPRFPTSTG
jgi:hypothetical protein